ncbi:MAG: RrF2 family transcriptional regulator [Hyphomicrobiaceae bacterium]
MAYVSTGVEYALHCLLFLVDQGDADFSPGSRDLADLQGIPVEFTAKLFTKLQKAGLVETTEGLRGGIRLARKPSGISVHDVVLAVDGDRPIFECREIRGNCAVFGESPPSWAIDGVCSIHAVMIKAERAMRDSLKKTTLADLAASVSRKADKAFGGDVSAWLEERNSSRKQTGTRR